jgi:hypothetical protein
LELILGCRVHVPFVVDALIGQNLCSRGFAARVIVAQHVNPLDICKLDSSVLATVVHVAASLVWLELGMKLCV